MKLSLALLLAVALAMALFRSCGQGLRSQRRWERVRVSRSLGPKRQVSNWPCSLGLSSCPSRLRLRLNTMVPMVPSESPKQQPVGTERQPSELPDPLGQFWEYLAQGGRVWLLCDNWDAICLLGVGLLALGLWRTVQRHRRQVSGGDAACRKGPACGERGPTGPWPQRLSRTKKNKTQQAQGSLSRPREALSLFPGDSPSRREPPARPRACRRCCEPPWLPGAVLRGWALPRKPSPAGQFSTPRALIHALHCASFLVASRQQAGGPQLLRGQTAGERTLCVITPCSAAWRPTLPSWCGT